MDSFEQQMEAEPTRHSPEPVEAPAVREQAAATRLASTVGNQAFTRIAREGAGILPDGRAHQDVQEAIGMTRGSGQTLDPGTREQFGPILGDTAGDVRVHTDDTADALTRSVSARAFATGNDVYFARGEYQPESSEGKHLLAHELTHVAQQQGTPTTGPMVVSQPGDALEVEADEAAGELLG